MDRRANVKNDRRQASTSANASTRASASGSTSNTTTGGQPQPPPLAVGQLQDYALMVLMNNQLMMRFAIANGLSVPKVRVYFEKLAGGFEPRPIIKKWDLYDD